MPRFVPKEREPAVYHTVARPFPYMGGPGLDELLVRATMSAYHEAFRLRMLTWSRPLTLRVICIRQRGESAERPTGKLC